MSAGRTLAGSAAAQWPEVLDDEQRRLVAAVGHELKTPLAIVLGLCRRLLAAEDGADGRSEDVERIRAHAYALLAKVDELLLSARLQDGQLALERRAVDVAALVRDAVDGFRAIAEARQQELRVELPSTLIAEVDEQRLLSVLSNLLSNAVKHAPEGGTVRCSLSVVADGLRIEVADSGAGVAPDAREAVFERHRQAPGAAGRPAGSGLGLAIVRELVSLHGGAVALGDAPEGGALVTVTLPLCAGGGAAAALDGPAIDVAERQRPAIGALRVELDALAPR